MHKFRVNITSNEAVDDKTDRLIVDDAARNHYELTRKEFVDHTTHQLLYQYYSDLLNQDEYLDVQSTLTTYAFDSSSAGAVERDPALTEQEHVFMDSIEFKTEYIDPISTAITAGANT